VSQVDEFHYCVKLGPHPAALPFSVADCPHCTKSDYPPTMGELLLQARDLLSALIDPDPCRFDHNGDCQAHGFFGGPCAHELAKQFLAGEQQ
jgi:hypothetical protein